MGKTTFQFCGSLIVAAAGSAGVASIGLDMTAAGSLLSSTREVVSGALLTEFVCLSSVSTRLRTARDSASSALLF